MSQLFAVQGSRTDSVTELFESGMELFREFYGLRPSSAIRRTNAGAAVFPPLSQIPCCSAEGAPDGAWIGAAGTFFAEGCGVSQALQQFLASGDNFSSRVNTLDGCFALVKVDPFGNFVTVATDRIGSLHVYWAQAGDSSVICTSSLVLAALVGAKLDSLACQEYLATGTVWENRSLFHGITKLEAASVFQVHDGRIISRDLYWDISQFMYDRSSSGDVVELATAIKGALSTIAARFPNPIFDLTGGFDSRVLAAAMLNLGLPLSTVVNGSTDDADTAIANRIAADFGMSHRHQELRFTPETWWEAAQESLLLCDGECDAFEYARILDFQRRLMRDFDLSVNGSGGEVNKGYWWELLIPFVGKKDHFDAQRLARSRFVPDHTLNSAVAGGQDLVEHLTRMIQRTNVRLSGYPNTAKMDNVYLMARMQRWQGRIASSTARLRPCVSPLLFRRPLEVTLSAPPKIRIRHRMTRRLLEYLHPDLAAIPLERGEPALPLRMNNAVQFWPIVQEMGGKISHRLLPGFRHPPNPRAPVPWQNELFAHFLTPSAMQTASLYNSSFLQSLEQNAAFEPNIGRVVTLEMALRKITVKKPVMSTGSN
jgi:hypothetical protein